MTLYQTTFAKKINKRLQIKLICCYAILNNRSFSWAYILWNTNKAIWYTKSCFCRKFQPSFFWIFKKSVVKVTHVLVFVLVGFQQSKGLILQFEKLIVFFGKSAAVPKNYLCLGKNPTAVLKKNYVYVFFVMLIEKKYSVQDNWQEVISSNRKKNRLGVQNRIYRKIYRLNFSNFSRFLILVTAANIFLHAFFRTFFPLVMVWLKMVLFEQKIMYLIVVMDNNFKTRWLNFDDSTIGEKSSTFLKSKECDERALSTIKAGDRRAIYGKMEKNCFTTLSTCRLSPREHRQFCCSCFWITVIWNT